MDHFVQNIFRVIDGRLTLVFHDVYRLLVQWLRENDLMDRAEEYDYALNGNAPALLTLTFMAAARSVSEEKNRSLIQWTYDWLERLRTLLSRRMYEARSYHSLYEDIVAYFTLFTDEAELRERILRDLLFNVPMYALPSSTYYQIQRSMDEHLYPLGYTAEMVNTMTLGYYTTLTQSPERFDILMNTMRYLMMAAVDEIYNMGRSNFYEEPENCTYTMYLQWNEEDLMP